MSCLWSYLLTSLADIEKDKKIISNEIVKYDNIVATGCYK